MKIKALPPQDLLLKELVYEPTTGKVFYKKTKSGRHGLDVISMDKEGYYRICLNRETYRLHRIIYKMYYGNFDESLQIDHINGNTSDNRITNLQPKNAVGNARNQKIPSNNKTGHIGVCYREKTNRYRVSIVIDGINKEVGNFIFIGDAIEARKKAERENGYHKNHGRKNATISE